MLTEQAIRRLKPTTRDYWRADSDGDGTVSNLYLRVRTARNLLSGAIEGDASLKSVADEWYARRIAGEYKRPKQIRQCGDEVAWPPIAN